MRRNLFLLSLVLGLNFAANVCFADVTWEPDVRLTNNPAGSYLGVDRSISTDSQNRVHVVWQDYRDGNWEIYYKRSLDGGQTWGSDVRLTVNSSGSDEPSIATDPQNRVHVVWVDYRDSNYGEIYYKRSLDGGQTWGSDVRLTVNSASSYSPSIATDSQNRVHVVWEDYPDGDYSDIYYKRSLDGGQTWGSDVRLTVNSAYSWYPSIATDPQNRVHVVWWDQRDGNGDIYYKRSLDGGQTWGSDVRLTVNSAASWVSSIATDFQNRVHVVWEDWRDDDDGDIYYKRSLDGGQTWGSDVRLTVNSATSAVPSIATDSQNRVHVVWLDWRDGYPNFEIYYKRSLDGGQTWGSDVRLTVNSASSKYPSIATDSQNRVHVVWQDYRDGNWEIYYKRGTQEEVTPSIALPGTWISNYATIGAIFGLNPTIPMGDVITDLQRMGVATVFLHTGGRGVTGPGQFFSEFPQANLAAFISLAHQAGLKVHAYCVDSHGSQNLLQGIKDGSFIAAVNEVLAWNSSHPQEKFDGIHLDIEDGLTDSDAQPLVDLYNQIDGLIGNLEFSAAVDAKTSDMSPTERGMDYAQLAYPLDLIVPMAYIMDKGFYFDPVLRGWPKGDFNYVGDVLSYTQETVGTNAVIGLGLSAFDRVYALDRLGNQLAKYDYPFSLWNRDIEEPEPKQDMYSLKYDPALIDEGTSSYPGSGLELFRFGVTSPSGFTFYYWDGGKVPNSVVVPQGGHLAAYQTTQDSLESSINWFPENYCFWDYDSIYHSRRMGLFTVEVDVEPDRTSVPQGGKLRIQTALTNHLAEPATFKLTFDVTEPPGGVKTIIDRQTITLPANRGEIRYQTYTLSGRAPLGNWIFTATVEGVGSNIYDQDSFDFKVTPRRLFQRGSSSEFEELKIETGELDKGVRP